MLTGSDTFIYTFVGLWMVVGLLAVIFRCVRAIEGPSEEDRFVDRVLAKLEALPEGLQIDSRDCRHIACLAHCFSVNYYWSKYSGARAFVDSPFSMELRQGRNIARLGRAISRAHYRLDELALATSVRGV